MYICMLWLSDSFFQVVMIFGFKFVIISFFMRRIMKALEGVIAKDAL